MSEIAVGSPTPGIVVDRSRGIAFVHVRKTGGNSIKEAMHWDRCEGFGAPHCGLQAFPGRDACFTFAFVRNPFDRMVSWFKHARAVGRCDTDDANEWLRSIASGGGGISTTADGLSPQAEQIRCGGDRVDFVGRFEMLAEDWRSVCLRAGLERADLPHRNGSSAPSHYRDVLDQASRRWVERVFRPDLDEFGYEW